mmetsp:Transcript_7156/g.11317  ORF Transcript_7156/g.11317 Transcript_7156/m.11317 type:complete len:132 (+) Transcript_7156:508-903(+)
MIIKGTQRCYLPPPIHTRFEYPAFSSSFTARMERTPPSQPTTIFSSNSGNASFTSSTNFSFFSVNVVPCAQARNCCTFLSSPTKNIKAQALIISEGSSIPVLQVLLTCGLLIQSYMNSIISGRQWLFLPLK